MILNRTGPGRSQTKLYTFQIVIEKEAQGEGYTAFSPTLPGCFRRAATIEEAKERVREAVRERVDTLLARGEPIAQGERLMHVEELSIALPESAPEGADGASSAPEASARERRKSRPEEKRTAAEKCRPTNDRQTRPERKRG